MYDSLFAAILVNGVLVVLLIDSALNYFTGMADLSYTSRWWFHCECVHEAVCPKTCRHIARRMMNGWLWNFAGMSGTMMPTLCQNVGGDPVTQFNLKKRFIVLFTLFYGHGAP